MTGLEEVAKLTMRTAFPKVAGIVSPASRLTTILKPDVAGSAYQTHGADTTTAL